MTIVLRSEKGSNLTPAEADGNITDLDGRVTDLEENPPVAVPPSNMIVSGTQWTIYYPDGLTFGPFTLPQANFRPSIVAALDVPTDGIYVPVLADANRYKRYEGSTDATIMVPLNATVPFAVDTEITWRVAGTGALIFGAATDGPTINGITGFLNQASTHGATVTMKKVGTDEWDLIGLLDEDA